MNNYGYVVITTEEYKSLIEDINNKQQCISELNKFNQKDNKRYKIFENLFAEKLIKDEEYHFENMKDINVTDYHYQQLFKEFLKIGIDDIEYVDLKIKEIKHKLDTLEKVDLLEGEK